MSRMLPALIVLSVATLAGLAAVSRQLHTLKGIIMATKAEANAKFDELDSKLDKISGETTNLVKEVRDLKEAAANGDVPDDIVARIDRVLGKAEGVDGLVDDVAPNPTETPPADEGTGEQPQS